MNFKARLIYLLRPLPIIGPIVNRWHNRLIAAALIEQERARRDAERLDERLRRVS